MRAVVYDRPRAWSVRDVPDLQPAPGMVRVAVLETGVCGTDAHLHQGEFGPVYPLTPGHEIVGVVDAVGDGVEAKRIGETVAVDNMLACGHCAQCLRARPQFCASMHALGVTDPGGFAEQVVVPAGKAHPVGDLDLDLAVLAEPTACVVHGLDVLALHPGTDVLVLGAGPTGLILTQLLRAAGAARVTVAARDAAKRDLAADLGADATVALGTDGTLADLRRIAPDGFDAVIDATGAAQVLRLGTELLAIGATLFVYGMAAETARLDISPYDVFRRELVIKGSFSQAHSFDRALALLRGGRLRADGIITHHFDLDHYGEALAAGSTHRSCVKSVVRVGVR